MLHKNFLRNNYGGLNILFTKILIHSSNYVQHWPKKIISFFLGTNSLIKKIIYSYLDNDYNYNKYFLVLVPMATKKMRIWEPSNSNNYIQIIWISVKRRTRIRIKIYFSNNQTFKTPKICVALLSVVPIEFWNEVCSWFTYLLNLTMCKSQFVNVIVTILAYVDWKNVKFSTKS